MSHSELRPLERVILRMRANDTSFAEIGRRIDKRPTTVRRIVEMVEYKSTLPQEQQGREPHVLRPIERVVVRLRADGESYGEIGNRLSKSGAHVRRVDTFAQMKLDG